MSLSIDYLAERGLDPQTVSRYGVEWDTRIDRNKIVDRLGADISLDRLGPLSQAGVKELLWFPVLDRFGHMLNWICRPSAYSRPSTEVPLSRWQ
jgi:hypothetical protein